MSNKKKIFLTGGAGYVGAVLTPKLLSLGHSVTVYDLFLYGENVLDEVKNSPGLKQIKGDIRDRAAVEHAMQGHDTLIHLACISNDPSFELNPELGKTINYDAFFVLLDSAKKFGIKQFIYASSSSVYGIKEELKVTEELPLDPLTDYSKYKAMCEDILFEQAPQDMVCTIFRPATVCGYSPRLRLDLTVNILTNHAINKGKITVFGGNQYRPNLHINDMAEAYCMLLDQPGNKIDRKIWNVGYENFKVREIAEKVRSVIGKDLPIEVTPSDDNRSYRVTSEKIKADLGFEAKHSLEDAIHGLKDAFTAGLVPDSLTDKRYFNIKTMQEAGL